MIKMRKGVLKALSDMGYTSYWLTRHKVYGMSTMTRIRNGETIGPRNMSTLCELLKCQPGDLLYYVPDDDTTTELTYELPEHLRTEQKPED